MKNIIIFIALLAVLAESGRNEVGSEKFDSFDHFMQVELRKIPNQQPNNKDGFLEGFKKFSMSDQINGNIGNSTTQEIIERSGFKCEKYHVVSDDDYVTQLIRIVNPLVDRRQLKGPPVMLMHSGFISPAAYVRANASQHHPEEYPRRPDSKPFTSWNRSLGFMLANNGFDVFLVGIRGTDQQNQVNLNKTSAKSVKEIKEDKPRVAKKKDFIKQQNEAKKFWMFDMDDEIKFEMPRQIDKVLNVTNNEKVSILTYSQSTLMSFHLLSEDRDYAKKVHTLISMAPVINDRGTNWFIRYFYRKLCMTVPDRFSSLVFPGMLLTKQMRNLLAKINKDMYLRYSLIKGISMAYLDSDAKHFKLLKMPFASSFIMPISFQQVKLYCQQAVAGKIQKFDQGLYRNMKTYPKQPAINISDIHIDNWMIISASNDNFASPESVKRVLSNIKHPKPFKHIVVEGYNHLDLVAAATNDVEVNFPVLNFYNHFQLPPMGSQNNNNSTNLVRVEQRSNISVMNERLEG